MLDQNFINSSNEISGSDLKVRASYAQNLINKIEVSRNRATHVLGEINNNLAEIGKIEKQKEKILEKKKINKIQEEKLLDLKNDNYFRPKNSISL